MAEKDSKDQKSDCYYNEELKMWARRGEEGEARKIKARLTSPSKVRFERGSGTINGSNES